MKTIKISLFSLVTSVIILAGCTKKPVASFNASKTTSNVGEEITFTNTSQNASSYKWTITGISDPITEKDIKITFNSIGSKTISLEAFSDEEKKSDKKDLIISVVQPTYGNVTFWKDDSGSYYYAIYVTIDETTKSITNELSFGISGCGASGCANFTLATGTYNYTAQSSNGEANWAGSVAITKDGCKLVQLH